MKRRFIVTYEYVETVDGERRAFVHDSVLEAEDEGAAYAAALVHYETLTAASGVGWIRQLERVTVKPAPSSPKGRRVDLERTGEE